MDPCSEGEAHAGYVVIIDRDEPFLISCWVWLALKLADVHSV